MNGVTEQELKDMEAKVLAETKAKEDILRKEIETKMKAEAELKEKQQSEELAKKELENKTKALEEEKIKLEEMIKLQAETKAKEIEELKSQIGGSRAIRTPFNDTSENKPKTSNTQEIDDASKEAFFEHIKKKQ